MEHKKRVNNKGFSLVELIVVVLIMAIISVSLAPQVMKWVNNARIAVDRQTVDSVVSVARLALTDPNAYNAVVGSGGSAYSIEITDDECIIKRGTSDADATDAFVKAFCDNMGVSTSGSVNGIVLKSSDKTIIVTVDRNGLVSSNAASELTSSDLD